MCVAKRSFDKPCGTGERLPVRQRTAQPLDSSRVVHPSLSPAPGPVRTCIGCRRRVAKSELLRVVAGSDAEGRDAVRPDPHATAPGRGAHLHPTTECYDLAVRRRAFTRVLRAPGGLSAVPVRDYLDRLAR